MAWVHQRDEVDDCPSKLRGKRDGSESEHGGANDHEVADRPYNRGENVISHRIAKISRIDNFVVVCAAVFALAAIAFTSQLGRAIVHFIPLVYPGHLEALAGQTNSLLMPLCLFIYDLMVINIVLGVFNLIPVPLLDVSFVLRHFLPDPVRRAYDMMGWIGLLILVYFGGGLLGRLI